MKKILFATLIAVIVSGTAVANEKIPVNYQVTKSFEKEFSGAKSVSWETLVGEDIYHAVFIYNNERMNAYFNAEGKLLAKSRYIVNENLPMLVSKRITEGFNAYSVFQSMEYVTASGTSYIVTLENEKSRICIRAFGNGSFRIIKKEKKNNMAKL